MEKSTVTELGDTMVATTLQFTEEYFKRNKVEQIDRTLWMALHIGFASALQLHGYTEDEISQSIKYAQDILKEND